MIFCFPSGGATFSRAPTCSLRRSDVHGVLIALMDIIPDELGKGSIVNLGKLGSFYVSVKSEGTNTAAEPTPGMVTGMKIQYRRIHPTATSYID